VINGAHEARIVAVVLEFRCDGSNEIGLPDEEEGICAAARVVSEQLIGSLEAVGFRYQTAVEKYAQVPGWAMFFEICEGSADIGGCRLFELAFFQIDVVKRINQYCGILHSFLRIGSRRSGDESG
jgi:hypothetical protein